MIEKADAMMPSLYRVQRVFKETEDTFTLELGPANGSKKNGAFAGGQFNMLYIFGVGEIPISICGDPADSERILHTTRAVGTVTRAMRGLKRGDVVGVRGPFGSSWPVKVAQGKDVIVIAGGIGLAPLRPVLYHLISHRKEYRKIILLYGARTPEDILYGQELTRWAAGKQMDVHVTVDRATRKWRGSVGVVTMIIPKVPLDPANAIAMLCGPEVMMRFSVQELQKRGLVQEQIYLSMERNMKCAVGFCGHCQYGSAFVCKDGPVFRYDKVEKIFGKREI